MAKSDFPDCHADDSHRALGDFLVLQESAIHSNGIPKPDGGLDDDQLRGVLGADYLSDVGY